MITNAYWTYENLQSTTLTIHGRTKQVLLIFCGKRSETYCLLINVSQLLAFVRSPVACKNAFEKEVLKLPSARLKDTDCSDPLTSFSRSVVDVRTCLSHGISWELNFESSHFFQAEGNMWPSKPVLVSADSTVVKPWLIGPLLSVINEDGTY